MAEAIYKHLTNGKNAVYSRGLVVLFPEPPNAKAVTVMENHRLFIGEYTSAELSLQDFTKDTIVLTMEEKQKEKIQELFGNQEQLYTLHEFVGEKGEVPDPYGKDLMEYEECYLVLQKLIQKLIEKLNSQKEK